MAKEPKIASIGIDLPDGESVTMGVEQARTLMQQLKKLFGDDKPDYSPVIIERYRDRPCLPYVPWMGPVTVTHTTPEPKPQRHEIWCSADKDNLGTLHLTA